MSDVILSDCCSAAKCNKQKTIWVTGRKYQPLPAYYHHLPQTSYANVNEYEHNGERLLLIKTGCPWVCADYYERNMLLLIDDERALTILVICGSKQ